jgi:flagellar biosynthesis protein FliR
MFKSLECMTCNGAMKMKTIAKLIIEVFFRLLHYIVTLYLPVVFTAITTSKRVVLGILNSAEDIDVFVVNINVQ